MGSSSCPKLWVLFLEQRRRRIGNFTKFRSDHGPEGTLNVDVKLHIEYAHTMGFKAKQMSNHNVTDFPRE
jgi:hypothetical protein